MNPRICRCCGEPMSEQGNALSRNPNICASCSSMADGMDESGLPAGVGSAPAAEDAVGPERFGPPAAEPVVSHVST